MPPPSYGKYFIKYFVLILRKEFKKYRMSFRRAPGLSYPADKAISKFYKKRTRVNKGISRTPQKTSKTKGFLTIVNNQKLITIFAKVSTLDVCGDPRYTSEQHAISVRNLLIVNFTLVTGNGLLIFRLKQQLVQLITLLRH